MKKQFRVVYILSFVLMGLSLLVVCNSNQPSTYVINNSLKKVVEITVYDEEKNIKSQGTGFFINSEGYIVTNKHIVHDSQNNNLNYLIKGRTINNNEYQELELIEISKEHDLALLKLSNNKVKFKSVKFKNSDNLKYGDSIYTIGNTYGYGLSVILGNISAPERLVEYNKSSIKAIQMNVDIEVGNSGGPVLDRYGRVVGIVTFRILDVNGNKMFGMNFALSSNTINEFIKNYI